MCSGPHEGSEGTVTSAAKAWLHVQLADGTDASVRRFMLQPLPGRDGAGAAEAASAAAGNAAAGPVVVDLVGEESPSW